MDIIRNFSLKRLNTFGIDATSSSFLEVNSIENLKQVLQDETLKPLSKLILGGGSNILFTKDFDGLVIKNNIKGIEKVGEDDQYIYVKSGAGEVWHQFVMYCIQHNYGGVENLSLIPGTVGASPMQNIGAYGVELKEVFHELEAMDIESGASTVFNKESCKFGYRYSIFKDEVKGRYVIVSVTFRLTKKPVCNTSYGAIEAELKAMQVSNPGIKEISEAVCSIRRSKLPDPAVIGNAGSFFKNPEVPEAFYHALKGQYNELPGYPAGPGKVKIAAGWLIEQCGWKGKQIENYGVHKNQALVLVNYGGAKGIHILRLSNDIKESVKNKFGIDLETEVNII